MSETSTLSNTFSWSSNQSSVFTQTTIFSIQQDSILTYLSLHGYLDIIEDQEQKERLDEIVCNLASQGDLEKLHLLLILDLTRDKVQLDAIDNDGWSPLFYASFFDKVHVVRYILKNGVQVNIQDNSGWTPLMWAIENNHCDMVELLLDHNASVDIFSLNGMSAHDLIDKDNERMVHIFSSYPRSYSQTSDFAWNHCLPHQMLVFSDHQVDTILNIAISNFFLPIKSRSELHLPANIIFFCARYAQHYTTQQDLNQLLSLALKKIDHVIKSHTQDVHTLAFWISNLSQLFCYIKKDTKLLSFSTEYQIGIADLISEGYTTLVYDSQRRLERILEPSMLEYEPLGEIETTFSDDWQRFFRRSSINLDLSPETVIQLLDSILYVLQSYSIQPAIINQILSQLFHFISCELFNRILSNKRFLCRSRALQIRMNISVLEDWLHKKALQVESFLTPVIQMTQLLQCLSQLTDLMDFIHTINTFELLNPAQIQRIVVHYRYEVNETRLPDEIVKYTMKIAQDTLKQILPQLARTRSSFGLTVYRRSREQSQELGLAETKDSGYLLPFSLPTDRLHDMTHVVPVIPEDWLRKLDQAY